MRTRLASVSLVFLAACASPGSALQLDARGPGATCSTPSIASSCLYLGEFIGCRVACELPSDCTFEVEVDWGSACPPLTQRYADCVCEDGVALCAQGRGEREQPRTSCSPRIDAGPPPPDASACVAGCVACSLAYCPQLCETDRGGCLLEAGGDYTAMRECIMGPPP